jgi:hypothetical protein
VKRQLNIVPKPLETVAWQKVQSDMKTPSCGCLTGRIGKLVRSASAGDPRRDFCISKYLIIMKNGKSFGIALFIFFIFILIGAVGAYKDKNVSNEDKTKDVVTKNDSKITHPLYLSAPNDYLVDTKSVVKSDIPFDTGIPYEEPLWVESVGDDGRYFNVSYIITIAEKKVIKTNQVFIPGVDFNKLSNYFHGDCITETIVSKLEKKFVGKYIYLFLHSKENSSLILYTSLMWKEGDTDDGYYDVSEYVIKNGLGFAGVFITDNSSYNYLLNEPGPRPYEKEVRYRDMKKLNDLQSIAKLSKYGVWGRCYSE